MNDLTLEQALNNINIAIDQFKGTKAEHTALEASLILIKKKFPKLKIYILLVINFLVTVSYWKLFLLKRMNGGISFHLQL